jgi:hypothetical protein
MSTLSTDHPVDMNPANITYLPRYHVGRRWSPEEILAIKLPSEISPKNRQNSVTEVRKTLAAGASERKKKKDERKKRILFFITSKQRVTTTGLLSLMGEKTNRTTLYELIKELEVEGLIQKNGWEWTLKIGTINDSPN